MPKAKTGAIHEGGREHTSRLLRNSYRQDGKVEPPCEAHHADPAQGPRPSC